MPVYVVTGKLGGGKSLTSTARIRDYLLDGRKVATNLNIYLPAILGKHKKTTRLYRVPDKPTRHDLEALGRGNSTYDESKNGLLCLDECGTWFNSRTWNDKSRQPMIDWCLHARKLGWDIIFIIQDESLIDKQARLALAEHVVNCSRTDRINVPIVGGLYKAITGSRLPLPRVHVGTVRYGSSASRIVVDRWVTVGTSLYQAYDTKQVFSDHYDNGTYSVLPTWYTHGRYEKPLTVGRFMRLTKIYFRQFSRVFLAFSFLGIGLLSGFVYGITRTDTTEQEQQKTEEVKTLLTQSGFVASFVELPDSRHEFTIDIDGDLYDLNYFIDSGYNVQVVDYCTVKVFRDEQVKTYYCR